jgi:hypothetical protein
VLLEMAADLESLYDHYRRGGADEEVAREWALARLLASPEAMQGLLLVHTTPYQRLVVRAATGVRWGFDLFLFIVGVVPLLLMSAHVVVTGSPAGGGGWFRWAVVGIGLVTAAIGIWKARQIFVRRERSTTVLNRGLVTLLFLSMVGPVIGGTGFLVALVGMNDRMARSDAYSPVLMAAETIAANGTVFALAILLGIAGALVWFVLINRIATIEREESALLLGF